MKFIGRNFLFTVLLLGRKGLSFFPTRCQRHRFLWLINFHLLINTFDSLTTLEKQTYQLHRQYFSQES